ncbi:MAG TPA: dipeptidase [Gemmatimonadales bacterium]|nr:dipeptidase [Gemmatimonadales bacterium]
MIKPIALVAAVSFASTALLAAQDYRREAIRILRGVPLIDGHNDIPDALRDRPGGDSVNLAVSQPTLMTDITRLRSGQVGGQFWAAYVPVSTMHEGVHPAVYALEQIDFIARLCAKYPATFATARTAADVERNFKASRISCLIGIEGGHAIENSLGALRTFAELGVRYMTLTHWQTLDWADAATDSARHGGLTPFGEQVVLEMNRLGMLVDLSHVSDGTMIDALRVTRAPVIYSHSSARAIARHVRNVPDSILRRIPANGGLVMVNFNPPFVSEARRVHDARRDSALAAMRAAGVDSLARRDSLRAWNGRAPAVTMQQVADHVDHIRKIAGVDHVGLGSDFDGISSVPVGLEDVGKFPDLIAELLRRGWTEADVRKLAGLNVLRVLREAERVASRQSSSTAP